MKVRAAGVNFPDILIVEGKYQLKPPFPFTPGSECAGVVTELGVGVDSVGIGAIYALMQNKKKEINSEQIQTIIYGKALFKYIKI